MGLFKSSKKEKNKKTEAVAAVPATPNISAGLKQREPALGRVFLKQPWASEKAHRLGHENKYVFLVSIEANKPLVKSEIEQRYGVKVTDVNIITQKGKAKRLGNQLGRRSDFKKAIVTLRTGDKIEIS